MKKYPEAFIKEVLEVFEAEGINAAHERYQIPKNTIYRWKGRAEMDDFLDGKKKKTEAVQESPDTPVGIAAEADPPITLDGLSTAPGRKTAPESSAGTEQGQQPTPGDKAPGAPASALQALQQAAGEFAKPGRDREAQFVETAILSAHRLLYGDSGKDSDALVFIIKENERLRKEINQLRRAIQIMNDVS